MPFLNSFEFRKLKGKRPLVSVTAYDFYSACLAQEAEVDFILVGDSLGSVIQGHDNTLKVTLDHMVYHTDMVSRGASQTFVVGDLPYLTYHLNTEHTVRNAARLIVEGGAQAVKLEGGRKRLPMIEACLQAEIPVMGHIGLTPQSYHALGGYKVQDNRQILLEDARALDRAGAFAIVLEAMPADLAREITEEVSVPTIGIGAGVGCDGQIIVYHDVLGYHNNRLPKFVKPYAQLYEQGVKALKTFANDVREKKSPDAKNSYGMQQQKKESS